MYELRRAEKCRLAEKPLVADTRPCWGRRPLIDDLGGAVTSLTWRHPSGYATRRCPARLHHLVCTHRTQIVGHLVGGARLLEVMAK